MMLSFCAAVPKIMSRTHSELPIWRIGTTTDTAKTHAELGRPACFQSWAMEEFHAARDLEAFFTNLGMRGDLDGVITAPRGSHVYIVKQRGRHCEGCETRPRCGRH
jgi:hypothetical protein